MYAPGRLRESLRVSLAPADRPVEALAGRRPAAVLIPLVDGPEATVVFTKRTDDLPRHRGRQGVGVPRLAELPGAVPNKLAFGASLNKFRIEVGPRGFGHFMKYDLQSKYSGSLDSRSVASLLPHNVQ